MKLAVDGNKIWFYLSDLIGDLEYEERERIIESFGWHSEIWEKIKDAVQNDFAADNVSPTIHKLRMHFLQGQNVKKHILRLFQTLFDDIIQLQDKNRYQQKVIRAWEVWYRRNYGFGLEPDEVTRISRERPELVFTKESEVREILDKLGITDEDLEHPDKE